MSLNRAELHYVCQLLDRQIAGGAVQKIHQPQDNLIVLESYGGSCGRARLLVDLTAGSPLLYLAGQKLKNPESPTAFCTLLRKHLTNARIRQVGAFENDRVGYIRFEKMIEDGPRERRLILELIPGYPVLFLLDEKNKILAATQSVRNQQRNLGRGDVYEPPPAASTAPADTPLFTTFEDWNDENLFALLEESKAPKRESIDRPALAKEVARALKRQRKKISKIEVDLRRMVEQEVGGDQGELLKSAFNDIRQGMSEIRVRDWGQEGEVWVTIPLDPSVSPQENLERLFKKAKKAARGLEQATGRLEEQRTELQRLSQFDERLRNKNEDLETLARDARKLGLKIETREAQPAKKKVVQVRRKPYKTYQSKDGLEIRVGRTSRDNDDLTFQHCKGNEWWFHADGYAGSHVVVKTSDELPQETLLDAATLAVEFSKASSGGKQAVSYTRRKNVSKYKGAKMGQVILQSHKTVLVRFEENRLLRLQKSSGNSKD